MVEAGLHLTAYPSSQSSPAPSEEEPVVPNFGPKKMDGSKLSLIPRVCPRRNISPDLKKKQTGMKCEEAGTKHLGKKDVFQAMSGVRNVPGFSSLRFSYPISSNGKLQAAGKEQTHSTCISWIDGLFIFAGEKRKHSP